MRESWTDEMYPSLIGDGNVGRITLKSNNTDNTDTSNLMQKILNDT